jgi:hypothetical protein
MTCSMFGDIKLSRRTSVGLVWARARGQDFFYRTIRGKSKFGAIRADPTAELFARCKGML